MNVCYFKGCSRSHPSSFVGIFLGIIDISNNSWNIFYIEHTHKIILTLFKTSYWKVFYTFIFHNNEMKF